MNFIDVIFPEEIIKWINSGKKFQLIDITEENLLKNLKIEFYWIPGTTLLNRISEIEKNIPVILSCRVGADSFIYMNILRLNHHFDNVLSLKSGYEGLNNILSA